MKHTYRGLFLTLVFSLLSVLSAFGNGISVTLDGAPLPLSAPAVIENDRVLVPMRSIMEALGYEVEWFEEEQGVKATKGETVLYLPIDNTVASMNGAPVKLDAPATLINGTTMVPLRFVSIHSGATVVWDNPTKQVQITTTQSPQAPVIENPADSVALIQTNKMQGSAIALSEDGLFCSNYHVLAGANTLQMIFNDGTIYQGAVTIVGINPVADIVLFRIDKTGLIPVHTQTRHTKGEAVLAIGSPLGVRNKQTTGIINDFDQDMISFSAPVNQGSSGGALFNKNNELIGMSSAFDPDQSLAIPVSLILDTPQDLELPIGELKNYVYTPTTPKNLRFRTEGEYTYLSWSPQYDIDYFNVYLAHTEDGAFKKMTNDTTKDTRWYWGFPHCFGISVSDKHPVYVKVSAVRDGVETELSEIIKLTF